MDILKTETFPIHYAEKLLHFLLISALCPVLLLFSEI